MDPIFASQMNPPMQGGIGSMLGTNQQTNPWFNIANTFVPRNLHDVIRWARYIVIQSPTTSEVTRKYSSYPITEFIVDTKNTRTREQYLGVMKNLKMKEALQNVGFEYFTLGNVFISVYFPIHRTLTCPSCKTNYSAKKAPWITFKQFKYSGECPHCHLKVVFERHDTRSMNVKDIHLIQWTPEHILVNHNQFTGETEYYYKIPNSIKQKVQKGDSLFVNSLPWELIEAVKNNQDFKFDSDQIFHMKNISTGGSVEGIAVPPILSLFSLVFYQATLRKANEAVALEHLNPMRVIFPAPQSSNTDMAATGNIRNFKSRMEEALLQHKRDKNHILIAPTAVGYQPIGGEGKNLLVSQEIQQAEETILLSLGVSRELLSGLTNWTSSSVGLRMMENMLTSYVARLEELLNWTMNKVSTYMNLDKCEVSMVPFKLLDDENYKQLLFQLSSSAKISDTTLFEELSIDFSKEHKRLVEEAGAKAATQVLSQYEQEQSSYLAAKKSADKLNNDNELQTALQKAQELANELYSADEGTVRKYLGSIKTTDYAQWLMVSKLLEDMRRSTEHQGEVMNEAGQIAQDQETPGDQSQGQQPQGQQPQGQ